MRYARPLDACCSQVRVHKNIGISIAAAGMDCSDQGRLDVSFSTKTAGGPSWAITTNWAIQSVLADYDGQSASFASSFWRCGMELAH
jgi:hypothetical protein